MRQSIHTHEKLEVVLIEGTIDVVGPSEFDETGTLWSNWRMEDGSFVRGPSADDEGVTFVSPGVSGKWSFLKMKDKLLLIAFRSVDGTRSYRIADRFLEDLHRSQRKTFILGIMVGIPLLLFPILGLPLIGFSIWGFASLSKDMRRFKGAFDLGADLVRGAEATAAA